MIVMAMAKCIAPLVKAKANGNVPIAMVMAKWTAANVMVSVIIPMARGVITV